jgi:large subunit ribosomal protein L37Ae
MRTAKYGVGVRKRIDAVTKLRAQKYKCPRCRKPAMMRVASGIWRCKRCGLEMADGAYSISTKEI